MSRSKNWACRAPVRHRKPGVFGGADALFGGADTLFGGADTLFGGADTLSPVHIYTHTHPAAPPKAHEPRFGGASVAHQKATGSHKTTCATGATEKEKVLAPWKVQKGRSVSGNNEVLFSVAPVALAWLVGYPDRGVGAVPATL